MVLETHAHTDGSEGATGDDGVVPLEEDDDEVSFSGLASGRGPYWARHAVRPGTNLRALCRQSRRSAQRPFTYKYTDAKARRVNLKLVQRVSHLLT